MIILIFYHATNFPTQHRMSIVATIQKEPPKTNHLYALPIVVVWIRQKGGILIFKYNIQWKETQTRKKRRKIYVYNPMVFIVLGSFCRTEGDFTLMCFNIKTVQCTFHSLFLVVVVVVFILFLPLLKYHTVYTFVASIFYYVRHHNFIFYCLRVWAPILCVRSFILLTLPLAHSLWFLPFVHFIIYSFYLYRCWNSAEFMYEMSHSPSLACWVLPIDSTNIAQTAMSIMNERMSKSCHWMRTACIIMLITHSDDCMDSFWLDIYLYWTQ